MWVGGGECSLGGDGVARTSRLAEKTLLYVDGEVIYGEDAAELPDVIQMLLFSATGCQYSRSRR
jgi:hypothetical protein